MRSKHSKPVQWLLGAAWAIIFIVGIGAGGLGGCDWWIWVSTKDQVHDRISNVAPAPVALLLGASPRYAGRPNPFYQDRIRAARELYASGKVRGILVSGDNRRPDYNEPARMKADLVRAGVPAEFITMDFAGVRTLDSVARASLVFQQKRIVVVTQRFHAERALFLARHFGIHAVAYAAEEPPLDWKLRVREILARALACADVWVLNRQPHFLGAPVAVRLRPVPGG